MKSPAPGLEAEDIEDLKVQPPSGGLLSSSCGGLKGPSGPKGESGGRTEGRTTGLRELDS